MLCSIFLWFDSYFDVNVVFSLRVFSSDSISRIFFSFINLFLSYKSNSSFKCSNPFNFVSSPSSCLPTLLNLVLSFSSSFCNLLISLVWSTSSKSLLQTGHTSEFCNSVMFFSFTVSSLSNIPNFNLTLFTSPLFCSNSKVLIYSVGSLTIMDSFSVFLLVIRPSNLPISLMIEL